MVCWMTLSSTVSADSLRLHFSSRRAPLTRRWSCGCCSEEQRSAGPLRPPPPHRCRCPRVWGVVWYGSSAGGPAGGRPWPHRRPKTGKTHHPPCSGWQYGSHQKWADWPSAPSVLLSSESVKANSEESGATESPTDQTSVPEGSCMNTKPLENITANILCFSLFSVINTLLQWWMHTLNIAKVSKKIRSASMQVIPVSQKLQTLHTWFVTRWLYRMSETVDILTLSHVWARSEENWLKGISNCLLQMLYDLRCCAKAWITSLRSPAPISSWTSSIFASLSCVSEAGLSVND